MDSHQTVANWANGFSKELRHPTLWRCVMLEVSGGTCAIALLETRLGRNWVKQKENLSGTCVQNPERKWRSWARGSYLRLDLTSPKPDNDGNEEMTRAQVGLNSPDINNILVTVAPWEALNSQVL